MITFKEHYEQLINALSNCEVHEADTYAQALLTNFPDPQKYVNIVDIDELKIGFFLDNQRLHSNLCTIIANSLCKVDFDEFCNRHGQLLKENAKKISIRPLFPLLIEQLPVEPACLVQSDLFPYFLLGLTDLDYVSEGLEGALRGLVLEDTDVCELIDKSLCIIKSFHQQPMDSIAVRIIILRLSLALSAEKASLIKVVGEQIFSANDILLTANALEIIAGNLFSEKVVITLINVGILDKLIEMLKVEESLIDLIIPIFIKMVILSPQISTVFVELLSNDLKDRESDHPVIIQLYAALYGRHVEHNYASLICNNARFETGPHQINAFRGIQLMFSFPDQSNAHESAFINSHFPEIFDFIALQIPIKGDEESRNALYELLEALFTRSWLVEKAFQSERFAHFMFDRSADKSITGLKHKYDIFKAVNGDKSSHLPAATMSRVHSYLSEGVTGRGLAPVFQVASEYGQ